MARPIAPDIIARLQQAMDGLHLDQVGFATRIGRSQSQINRWMNGHGTPSLRSLNLIAAKTGVPAKCFMKGELTPAQWFEEQQQQQTRAVVGHGPRPSPGAGLFVREPEGPGYNGEDKATSRYIAYLQGALDAALAAVDDAERSGDPMSYEEIRKVIKRLHRAHVSGARDAD